MHRLGRAKEAIQEAELLLDAEHVNTVVNRLYYACFYAVTALLLSKGFSSSKHTGIRSLFHQKVVKLGLVNASLGHPYDRLFDSRQKSDYADLVSFESDDVRLWMYEARGFVGQVENLIEEEIKKQPV